MKEAIYHFPVEGKPRHCEQIKSGHINETCLITTDTGARHAFSHGLFEKMIKRTSDRPEQTAPGGL